MCRCCCLLHAASCFDNAFGGVTLLPGVAILGVFLLLIKACLRCLFWLKSGMVMNEAEPRERVVLQAGMQYLQFMFTQNKKTCS